MNLVDWILNIAGVFLWMEWRSAWSAKPQAALSIASAVRTAGRSPTQGLGALAGLLALLLVRPVFYYSVGVGINWTPTMDFLAISVPWRSDLLERMYIFSFLSFGKMLGYYYAWLLLFSAVNRRRAEEDMIQQFVRGQLGWLEKIPWCIKLLLPSIVLGLVWIGLRTLLAELELVPRNITTEKLWGQAGAFALAAILAWKWPLIVIFLVHLLNIYLYLGKHPIWNYIGNSARVLLVPFSFLRIGRLDLAPVAGTIAVLALAGFVIEPAVLDLFRKFMP